MEIMEVKRLDHLGVVMGVIKELGIIRMIDDRIKPDSRENVTTGEAIAAEESRMKCNAKPDILQEIERHCYEKIHSIKFGRKKRIICNAKKRNDEKGDSKKDG